MISIIGAGPAGSYLAYLLAKQGKEVSLFEDHSRVGVPIQCTGLVTSSIEEMIKIKKEFLINKIPKVRIVSPDGNYFELKFNKPNILFHRAKFDQYVAELAENAGVKICLNHKFKDYKKPFVSFENNKKYKTDYLVGADGPASKVAQVSGLYNNRKFVIGMQARYTSNIDKDTIEFWLDKQSFGWVVPESESIARIGIVAYSNHNLIFKEFLNKLKKKVTLIEYQSGLIPIYDPNVKTQKNEVYLLGDAATMVKATTYGGIIQGMQAAEELTKAIISNGNYEGMWRKRVGKELYLHLLIRKTLDKFSKEDCNELIEIASKQNVKYMLENFDRDFPSKFLLKLIFKEPRLLKYGLKALI